MKGTIKVLNSSGHSVVEYDTEEGVVSEAEAILAQASYAGSAVFNAKTREPIRAGRKSSDRIPSDRDILQEHDDLLVIPPMAGG